MNCFPCKGPACNSCKKFDRINEMVRTAFKITCKECGYEAKVADEVCPKCGQSLVVPPGCAR